MRHINQLISTGVVCTYTAQPTGHALNLCERRGRIVRNSADYPLAWDKSDEP